MPPLPATQNDPLPPTQDAPLPPTQDAPLPPTQNAQRKSTRTKNTVSYTGLSAAGATAPPASLTKFTRKSVLKSSKPKPKRRKTEGIHVQEGDPLSKGAVRIL